MADPGPIDYRTVLEQLRANIRVRESRETELKGQLAAVSADLAELRRAVRALARLAGEEGSEPDGVRRPLAYADRIRAILECSGRPLRVHEIVDLMVAGGQIQPGNRASRATSIYSAMKRRPQEFQKIHRGLWALTGTNGNGC